MNIGIVTTWFERGAAYVSKQFEEVLEKKHNIFIYARGGEQYGIGDPIWDKENVWWSRIVESPFGNTLIDKKDFTDWTKRNKIQLVVFNEQHWWYPIIWCKELGIKTVGYIDFYKEDTIPLFQIYDGIICNTQKHYSVFKNFGNSYYIPWGTDINVFKPSFTPRLVNENIITFFHSCGMAPFRKGTDFIIESFYKIKKEYRLIIHTQVDIKSFFPDLSNKIDSLVNDGRLQIIQKNIGWPGLYHMGDIYVYPSRLEGIGLTVAEALASGLGILVPDNAPMNEFLTKKNGFALKINRYYCRKDAYYWPIGEIDIEDLICRINLLITNKDKVINMKTEAFEHATTNLDWKQNSHQLLKVIEDVINKKPNHSKKDIDDVIRYEKLGMKKFNLLIIKFQWLYKLFKKISRK